MTCGKVFVSFLLFLVYRYAYMCHGAVREGEVGGEWFMGSISISRLSFILFSSFGVKRPQQCEESDEAMDNILPSGPVGPVGRFGWFATTLSLSLCVCSVVEIIARNFIIHPFATRRTKPTRRAASSSQS